ncbi:tRNA synthetases class II (A)-domain-containing protein [Blastocladiella britannica]|nr:tRNA synthetases class II (A)-domain-containing protein [Blastocladiella britannica]
MLRAASRLPSLRGAPLRGAPLSGTRAIAAGRYGRHLRNQPKPRESARVRASFQTYFADRGHTRVSSSSLIPHGDASLLFTNAGMNQFKPHFLNPSGAPYAAAVSAQRCVRAGGKHNDLDNVGHTPRHHTFFEMMGNFSFGAYSRREAVGYAWEFLTRELELPVDRLKVTVLESDREALDIWTTHVGLPRSSIALLTERDNWWAMGDVGPCGPCTEIFWDHGSTNPDDWLELWNVVFMDYVRSAPDGPLERLPTPCIDTGMGLERVCSVLNGSFDNYTTDLFAPLVTAGQALAPPPLTGTHDPAHFKILADHVKAATFLITDGVIPSPTQRGYVLRKIIRRASRSAHALGFYNPHSTGSITALVPHVLQIYSDTDQFGDLHARAAAATEILANEEAAYRTVVAKAERFIAHRIATSSGGAISSSAQGKQISAAAAFDMYSSHGFPLEVIQWIAVDHGWSVDVDGTKALLDQHRASGSARSAKVGDDAVVAPATMPLVVSPAAPRAQQTFIGYDSLTVPDATVTAVIPAAAKSPARVVVDPCPFYALGGGQAPDIGTLRVSDGAANDIPVRAVQVSKGVTALEATNESLPLPSLAPGSTVSVSVAADHRRRVAAHHSATHYLHWALRTELGAHVVQAGSSVTADRLTFDFTHGAALTPGQLASVQAAVNAELYHNHSTVWEIESMANAKARGAAMQFSDAYDDPNCVRVVTSGPTAELCAGTHVTSSLACAPVLILSDRSVAAGTRRIEAVAGAAAAPAIAEMQRDLAAAVKVTAADSPARIPARVDALLAQVKDAARSRDAMLALLARLHVGSEPVVLMGKDANAVSLQIIDPALDDAYLKRRVRILIGQGAAAPAGPAATVLVLRKQITVVVHDSAKVDARAMVAAVSQRLGGKRGGGSPMLATAKLDAARADPSQAEWQAAVLSFLF